MCTYARVDPNLSRAILFHSGAIQIVCGDAPAIGDGLLESTAVRKIGFTGSTRVGKMLMRKSADTVKRISLELGGNAPFIVFDDADLDKAAVALVASGLRNAGQTCICADRILVHDSVIRPFTDVLMQKMATLRLGHGLAASTTHGPLINSDALSKVESHVADAVDGGATLVTGGRRGQMAAAGDGLDGFFFEPTLITDVSADMKCFSEENFAPLLPLRSFGTDEEAVHIANSTEHGLAGYFHTSSMTRAW